MQSSKESYKVFCEKDNSIPVFLSYDWLETVAQGSWDVAIEERSGQIVGVLPYIFNRRKGFTFIELPPFTPFGGIWIIYPEGQKYVSKLSYEKDIIANLIKKLPPFDSFVQKFSPSFTNWLPFYWEKFKQTTYYTYILEDLSEKDSIMNGFKDDVRRNIRKAGDFLKVSEESDIDILYQLKLKAYQSKGMKINFSETMLKNIYTLCKKKNMGELLVAREGDTIHSATLFVWDKNTCYNLITASDPVYKNSDAVSLIIWHAVQRYSDRVKEFNFEGSMIRGIESFFQSFGARLVPYFVITKTNSKIIKIKDFLKDL